MAVTETLIKRTVQITVEDGTNVSGTTKSAKRTISNINPSATATQLHATAATLASLMDNTIVGIYYDDRKLLQELAAEDDEDEEEEQEPGGDQN